MDSRGALNCYAISVHDEGDGMNENPYNHAYE